MQSIEPSISDIGNGWLKEYGLSYKLQQESLNTEIDNALNEYVSKSGGDGGNRPDAKLLLQDKFLNSFPVLIEYKGYKNKLEKLDANGQVENRNAKNELLFKNINEYAVNGAVHYANALLHYTNYSEIIAIGMTGYEENGTIKYSIGVYYVSKDNFGLGKKVDEFTDFSFLKKENFNSFIEKIHNLKLTPQELEKLKQKREKEIEASLLKLNNDIYENEKGLSESDRVYLVAASIMSTLGIPGKVKPLTKADLKSSPEEGDRDGDIVLRKIQAFLKQKSIPKEKKNLIIRTLQNTICSENINKVVNNETQLKRVFSKIVDDLGIYYKIGVTTDFTGKLFNEMYNWLGFSQDKLNDVVLTPSYVANFLVKLARVNKDSYVWDFATGSAGLLVAAMNEMISDAKEKIKSPEELNKKIIEIKATQLLGLEILPSVYMLAILNMILMGDGSSNIINRDSIGDFEGYYEFSSNKDDDEPVKKEETKKKKFPATAFVLNPPYSAPGSGMNFVQKALSMMDHGYASIIIQGSAGAGKAKPYTQEILKKNTLLASIKMPSDLFVGKSNVQTYVYVFKVGEEHQKDDIVKFIDLSNDGYTRTDRRKSTNNLRDTGNAKGRYKEVVNLVRFGKSKLKLLTETEYYEGYIDPKDGGDWNQVAPVDTKPNIFEFSAIIKDSLLWNITNKIMMEGVDINISKDIQKKIDNVTWEPFLLEELFDIRNTKSFNQDQLVEGNTYDYVTRTSKNQGVLHKSNLIVVKDKMFKDISRECLNEKGVWSFDLLQKSFFYRDNEWYAGQFIKKVIPRFDLNPSRILYFQTVLNKLKPMLDVLLVRDTDTAFKAIKILLPSDGNHNICYSLIDDIISKIKNSNVSKIEEFIKKEYIEI